MNWLIVAGGEAPSHVLLHKCAGMAERIVAVDGAADLLHRECIQPDALIGDFDTASAFAIEALAAMGAQMVRLPTAKNMTDTEAAMDFALDAGASNITLLGALGGRMDHAMSNVGMLLRAHRHGSACRILDDINELFVAEESCILEGDPGQTVSIVPLTGNLVVTAEGLEYPLEELSLPFGSSRGVSNRMLSPTARLHISGGIALIIRILNNA